MCATRELTHVYFHTFGRISTPVLCLGPLREDQVRGSHPEGDGTPAGDGQGRVQVGSCSFKVRIWRPFSKTLHPGHYSYKVLGPLGIWDF